MDARATLTLVFAGIGALGTVYSVLDGFAKRRKERRREIEAIEAEWSVQASPAWRGGHHALALRCRDVTAMPISVVSIAAVSPHGTELCEGRAVPTGGGPPAIEPLAEAWTTRLDIDRDLHGTYAFNHETGSGLQVDWALLHLLARSAPKVAGKRGRYRLRLVVEERTAARRRRVLHVNSQEIAFTAQVDPDAR